ncbi:MAG: Gfo/Idh/MocA family oxidoreductase [Draconibacterium sp.]|nr:Gfo/Idh/MocA family oxidoreductase [Draconibacterium sp.]
MYKPKPRREFLKKAATVTAVITIVPNFVVGGLGHKPPSDKLNIVGVGVGGKGHPNLLAMKTENIIGLCDIDWNYSQKVFSDFPKAKQFYDWRKMYEELSDSIDGVMVATSDHTHAIIAATALDEGKHVYCQKPLTHSIYESRLLTKLAAKNKVATQMGNQGNSGDGVRQVCEWIWNNEIGEIKEVHSWTNRPIWPQGLQRPTETMSPPANFNWDLFVGPAPARPYHEIYTPWNWRGWWDFGTGAFGDMACHILDPVYQALKLGSPKSISGDSSLLNTESAPQAEKVKFTFAARSNYKNVNLPEVDVHWYDGGLLPDRTDLLNDVDLMADGMGGCLFVGSKDSLLCDTGGFNPRLLSGKKPNVEPYLRRIDGAIGYVDGPHEQDWIRACKESPENRVEGTSNFAYSGPFNEMVLLGVVAVRLQGLNKVLKWDAKKMEFTNISPNEKLKVVTVDEFKVIDGHPHFNTQYADFNALETANEYINHSYSNGWKLPAMPK